MEDDHQTYEDTIELIFDVVTTEKFVGTTVDMAARLGLPRDHVKDSLRHWRKSTDAYGMTLAPLRRGQNGDEWILLPADPEERMAPEDQLVLRDRVRGIAATAASQSRNGTMTVRCVANAIDGRSVAAKKEWERLADDAEFMQRRLDELVEALAEEDM